MSQNSEKIIIDEFDRVTFLVQKDFLEYVASKGMKVEQIRSFTLPHKEEFFLRWKHGLTDKSCNEELESNLQEFLITYRDTPLHEVDPYFRDSVKWRREFEAYCFKMKQMIGMVGQESYPKEVREIASRVGGKVTGYNPE